MKKTSASTSTPEKRIYYFDALRTVAIFFVIIIHCAAAYFMTLSPGSRSWLITNFFESISRWAVPIFVMISGALHLSKDRDLNTFFKKNILRIVTILLSWNLIYGIVGLINGSSLSDFICNIIGGGHYHLWFLYMLLGLYILTPFIKSFIKTPKNLKLFLIVSFIFGIVLRDFSEILTALPSHFMGVESGLNNALKSVGFGSLIGHSFYYVLGYYLYHKTIDAKNRKRLYIAGLIGLLFTFFATWGLSVATNSPAVVFIKDLCINSVLVSVGLFTFAKYHTSENDITKLLIWASKYSLGIYVMHLLLLENVFTLLPSLPVFIDIPVKAVSCFFVCLILTFCLRKIPFLRKIV